MLPREADFTVSISSPNTLPPLAAFSCSRLSARRRRRLHHLAEPVPAARCVFLQPLERLRSPLGIAREEIAHVAHLVPLLLLGRADQLRAAQLVDTLLRAQEGVDADDRQRTVVLAGLVVETLLLDAAALVHRFHRAQHAATLRDAVELAVNRFLDQVRQVVDCARTPPPIPRPV